MPEGFDISASVVGDPRHPTNKQHNTNEQRVYFENVAGMLQESAAFWNRESRDVRGADCCRRQSSSQDGAGQSQSQSGEITDRKRSQDAFACDRVRMTFAKALPPFAEAVR